jgi:hypothetical protein
VGCVKRKSVNHAALVSSSINEVETRVNRLKLEKRRQTLIHLGFRLSQGGLDAAIEKALG